MPKSDATVFVVDDDAAIRESLKWLIQSVDLPVETFASAQEFLRSYQGDREGCLVLDIRMPGMSGLELQSHLEKLEIGLPIIFITGHGDVPVAVRAMKAGAVDFIQKPFSDQVLLDRIQHAIKQYAESRGHATRRAAVLDVLGNLTRREREVMQLVVAGKPNKAIAVELGVTCKAIEAHRAKIMRKTKAGSLADLVRIALLAGVTHVYPGQAPVPQPA